ncbi:MAG TPA: type II secretion system protein N [Methylomirabilota bacterium]
MARRLLVVVDGLLLLAAAFLAVRLYETWSARAPAGAPEAPPPASTEAAAPLAIAEPQPPLTAYAVVAERNLFSPTRTEAPPEPPRAAAGTGAHAPPAPKPRLYGVVLLPEGRDRAYLEDVQRRRVSGYSVGDQVGDARLEQIRSDRVVLRRGAETFEVLLYDPTKPRQTTAPGVQSPETGGAGRPTVVRPPVPVPRPNPGLRAPVRPRIPVPAVPPPAAPGPEGQEPTEEE